MDDRVDIRSELSRILTERFFVENLSDDLDLVESGHIDSVGFMELFLIIENRYGIAISANDLLLDNFRTLGSLVEFVAAKRR